MSPSHCPPAESRLPVSALAASSATWSNGFLSRRSARVGPSAREMAPPEVPSGSLICASAIVAAHPGTSHVQPCSAAPPTIHGPPTRASPPSSQRAPRRAGPADGSFKRIGGSLIQTPFPQTADNIVSVNFSTGPRPPPPKRRGSGSSATFSPLGELGRTELNTILRYGDRVGIFGSWTRHAK